MHVAPAVLAFLIGLGAGTERPAASLEGPVWRLRALGDRDAAATGAGQAVTAQFESGRISGTSGCNRYTGSYTLEADRVVLGPLAGTMMACDEPIMALEGAFLKAFSGTVHYAIQDGRLSITAASGTRLVFEAEPARSIEGVSWSVTNYNNGRQAVVGLEADTKITLAFQDGIARGNAGCNDYHAAYTLDGSRLSVKAPASTRMMCPGEARMRQEHDFLAALETAATWSVAGSQLELRTADDALVLMASTVAPTPSPTPADQVMFRARGNEPFWSLEIGPAGLTYHALGEDALVFPYSPPRHLHGRLVWGATLPGPPQRGLVAALQKKPCMDTMSGEKFAWTALVRIDGRPLNGCAHEGPATPATNRP